MELWALIKNLREGKKMSQGQLGLKSSLGRSYIGSIETKRILNPGADKLFKLAKALEVEQNILLEAAGIKKPVKFVEENINAIEEFKLHLLGKNATKEEIARLWVIADALFENDGKNRDMDSQP